MTTTNTIQTAMCILPDLDWQGGCTDHPIGVYCAVTLQLLGRSEHGAVSQSDGTLRLRFAGVDMIASPPTTGSRWWTLAAIDPKAMPEIATRLILDSSGCALSGNRPVPMYVADGPDGHEWLLKRTTEDAARRDGLAYFLATRKLGVDGRWILA